MALPAIPIISGLFKLGQTWVEGKVEEKKAKTEARTTVIKEAAKNEGKWDLIMAQGSLDSWKDEYLLILFSIPLILSFIPGGPPHVEAGFVALEGVPEWYTYGLSVMVAGSYGLQKVVGFINAKNGSK